MVMLTHNSTPEPHRANNELRTLVRSQIRGIESALDEIQKLHRASKVADEVDDECHAFVTAMLTARLEAIRLLDKLP